MLDQWIRDLRVASRTLRRAPIISAAAIISLAVGTGVNVSTFSVVSAALFRPLPYPHAEDLYLIGHADQGGVGGFRWSYQRVTQLQRTNSTFSSLAGFTEWRLPITDDPV